MNHRFDGIFFMYIRNDASKKVIQYPKCTVNKSGQWISGIFNLHDRTSDFGLPSCFKKNTEFLA